MPLAIGQTNAKNLPVVFTYSALLFLFTTAYAFYKKWKPLILLSLVMLLGVSWTGPFLTGINWSLDKSNLLVFLAMLSPVLAIFGLLVYGNVSYQEQKSRLKELISIFPLLSLVFGLVMALRSPNKRKKSKDFLCP